LIGLKEGSGPSGGESKDTNYRKVRGASLTPEFREGVDTHRN